MSNPREGLARSVQIRLARHAREIGVDPNLVLTRYAIERFLYRLSRSPLGRILQEVADQEVEPDAVVFEKGSVRVEPIRAEDDNGGWRATIQARVGAARLTVQVDVGIGDAVTPAPDWLDYPSLLDLPRPRLRAYPRESVIAEKLHAIVRFGQKPAARAPASCACEGGESDVTGGPR